MDPWFLDNDGDGYHASVQVDTKSRGTGWTNVMTKGSDCNDKDAVITLCSTVGSITPTSNPVTKTAWYLDFSLLLFSG